MEMGLQVLYPSKHAGNDEVIKADIVAVHGPFGDSKRTWTSRETNAFWLKDFLPHDVPNARIMTFGYNADAAFGNTTADIIGHARSLLSSLIDKREGDDELRRPIIFIGHSLGGILIKQSLFQATIEQRYDNISESTVGILFLGTPHRGNRKAAYGKVLANLATAIPNRPSPRLVDALQVNSGELMQLTAYFRFQVPKYQVCSFYELKPMTMLSTLVVEKHSALLNLDGEEHIPVDANHEEMCKFRERDDDAYEMLFKRVRRMMEKQERVPQDSSYVCSASSYNKHYNIPHNLSAIFTGRDDIIQNICEGCLPSDTRERPIKQKRFVLYGLGGSGKTQICIKFAQDYQEKFWGIFWIDASSHSTAQQGFRKISRMCGVDEDPRIVRRWLSNIQDHWLLVIDNADDPSIDVSEFFPAGNNGSILLTTRNPQCKIHSTVGFCELGQMGPDEAVTLLLKASGDDDANEAVQKEAVMVTQILGFLALAIVQAGAYIQQGFCSIGEYCDLYTRRRQKLLNHLSVQARSDYKYSVYTTWEISVETIEKMDDQTSHNAIELIRILCFLHYDGITEDIFEQAWFNSYERGNLPRDIAHMFYMHPHEEEATWDPTMIREAAVRLASFSLIRIDQVKRSMSMHPLVHVWARDRLSEELQKRFWIIASSTLAATMSWKFQLADYRFRQSLLAHIETCISLCKDKPFLSQYSRLNRVDMAEGFAEVFDESGRLQEAVELTETVLKARQRKLGSEHEDTFRAMKNLANSYIDLGRSQAAMERQEKVLEATQRTLGSEHPDTISGLGILAIS